MLNLNDFERASTGMQDPSFFSSTIYLYCTESDVCGSGGFFSISGWSQGSDASLGRFSPMACYVKTVVCAWNVITFV